MINLNVHQAAACALSQKAYEYFNKKRYSIDNCNCDLKDALAAYFISKSDCDYTDELNCFVDGYKSSCNGITTKNCQDDITLSLSKSTVNCNMTSTAENPVDGSKFSRLTLVDNSIYHTASLNLKATNKCGLDSTVLVNSGCDGGGCSVTKNPYGLSFAVLSNVVGSNPNGYIKTITISRTSSTGERPLVNQTVDISPSNLTTWNSCGTCTTTYSSSDLLFGATNYAEALRELLTNVVKTLTFGNNSDFSVSKTDSITVSSKIKHKPTSYWAGINPDNFSLSWVNQAGSTINTLYSPRSASLNIFPSTAGGSIYYTDTIPTICGNYNRTLFTTAVNFLVNTSTSNLDLLNIDNFNSFIANTYTSSYACNGFELVGNATTDGVIQSVNWKNPSNTVIATTNSVKVATPGTYKFTATTLNGCSEEANLIV